jgi:hypothetical protein
MTTTMTVDRQHAFPRRRTGVSQGSAARNRAQALALNHNAARGAGKVNKAVLR